MKLKIGCLSRKEKKMEDLVYNENKLSETTDNLDNNIRKLRRNYRHSLMFMVITKSNWQLSGYPDYILFCF